MTNAVTLASQIEVWPVERLTPYERNSRTHSANQIAKIAASMTEFGFTNPILVDSGDGIIAGHGRLEAAKMLGLMSVPVQRFSSVSKSMQRNGVKDCICADCGTEFTVRKDTSPVVCVRCVSVRGGRANLGSIKAKRKSCPGCGAMILFSICQEYCSRECSSAHKRVDRECMKCGNGFKVLGSQISGKTNASGNFCSRPCYDLWLCQTGRTKNYGSRWKRVRLNALSKSPFCAVCGTSNRLDVHHIAPYRISFDNGDENLIPLCKKHHKAIEIMTAHAVNAGAPPDDIKLVIGSILSEAHAATFQTLKSIGYKGNYEHRVAV